jgi:hypothetical protein
VRRPLIRPYAVVAAGRTARALVTNNVMRYPLPLLIPKDKTIQNSHDCLQKTVLNLICSTVGTPRVHTT